MPINLSYEEEIDRNFRGFDSVDPDIKRFSDRYNLSLIRMDREYPIRRFRIDRDEIHILPPDAEGNTQVGVVFNPELVKESKVLAAPKGTLYAKLEEALKLV